MRIVLVFPDPPLPFGTAAARWYYVLLRGLQARGVTVTAYAACATTTLAEEAAQLFPRPEYDLRCFVYPQRGGWWSKWETLRAPYSYIFGPELKADLARMLAGEDCLLHLETHWSGWLARRFPGPTLVNVLNLYAVDLANVAPASWWDALRVRRVFAAEKELLRAFPCLVTLSRELADRLRVIQPTADVRVVPLGFDASLYAYEPPGQRVATRPVVGLIGSFNWRPTYTAGVRLLTRLWPEIRRRLPDARLLLVGRDACAALNPFMPKDDPDITVEENVTDILPYFRQLDVMLYAPGQGTGVKVKVLEAFALGVPVVTNREGIEGTLAEHGRHACIGEDDEELVAACVGLLTDRARALGQARQARGLLEARCGPAAVLDAWQEIYAQAQAGKVVRGPGSHAGLPASSEVPG